MLTLNCDMGEGCPFDEKIMPYIDMANIACGFHASDPHIMRDTVALAKAHHVSIGAHPGYPDKEGFGRRFMPLSHQEIMNVIQYQLGALQGICQAQGATLDYVKPHGALYHSMISDPAIMKAVFQAVRNFSGELPLIVMANGQREKIEAMAQDCKLRLMFEVFADRRYGDDGQLLSRQLPGSVLSTLDDIEQQVLNLFNSNMIYSNTGKSLVLAGDTLCVHGDSNLAFDAVKRIREVLVDFNR